MNFSKMDEYFEKSKLWIAYLFVFISILSMSSLVYKIANPLYKGLSAIVVLYICYTLLFKWKEITADRKFLTFKCSSSNLFQPFTSPHWFVHILVDKIIHLLII